MNQREITLGKDTIPLDDIDIIYHVHIKNKPGIVLRTNAGLTVQEVFWNKEIRAVTWKKIEKILDGEYFIGTEDLLFRAESVEALRQGINNENDLITVIGFRSNFELVRPYKDLQKMQIDFNELIKLLALIKALLALEKILPIAD